MIGETWISLRLRILNSFHWAGDCFEFFTLATNRVFLKLEGVPEVQGKAMGAVLEGPGTVGWLGWAPNPSTPMGLVALPMAVIWTHAPSNKFKKSPGTKELGWLQGFLKAYSEASSSDGSSKNTR